MSKVDDKLWEIFKNEQYSGCFYELKNKLRSMINLSRDLSEEFIKTSIVEAVKVFIDITLDNFEITDTTSRGFPRYKILINVSNQVKKAEIIGEIKTGWYVNKSDDKFLKFDYIRFNTDTMNKIDSYYTEKLTELKETFVDMAFKFKNNYCVSYDTEYNNYSIERNNASDYSNCISGDISTYRYSARDSLSRDELMRFKKVLRVAKIMSVEDEGNIMSFAENELGYEEESITWKAYKI